MKYLRCALALLCIPATLVLHWVAFPLSNKLSGVSFPIAGYVRGHTPPTLASYGVIAAAMLLIAAVMLLIAGETNRRQRWTFIYAVGAALLMLVVIAPVQVALGNAPLLKDLAEEANWLKAANNFTQTYLPLNLGNEATNWPFLSFNTVAGRLLSGWYFMGLGWYVTLTAAVVLMIGGARNMNRTARRRAAGATAAAVILMAAAFLLSPLAGQRTLLAAIRAESSGDIVAAAHLYRAAFRLDGWNALDIELRARAGAIDAALGATASSDYQVYRAESLLNRNLIPAAIAQYDALAAANGSIAPGCPDASGVVAHRLWIAILPDRSVRRGGAGLGKRLAARPLDVAGGVLSFARLLRRRALPRGCGCGATMHNPGGRSRIHRQSLQRRWRRTHQRCAAAVRSSGLLSFLQIGLCGQSAGPGRNYRSVA